MNLNKINKIMASIKRIKTSNKLKNNEENNNYIEKSFLEELLKCELCENIFDLNNHLPIIIKCGHTFCKECILNIHNKKYNKKNYSCPLDNTLNAFNIDSCVVNLRVELIIKKIFQKENQKQIVYSKPDMKKFNQINNNENLSNKKNNGEYGYKKYEEINDNLNTPQIEDEINTNNKLFFEDEKIKGVINETIDTIPLYDEKSFENVSFKEDVNELFEKKNIIANKKPILSDTIKKELNRNKYISNNIKDNIKKKDPESKINNNKVIKPLTKLIPNLSLTPNKNKDLKTSKEILLENNYNYTDRNYENEKRKIILENNHNIKNSNKIPELNKILKNHKNLKENDDIIILNNIEEEKDNKDLYLEKNNYPSKKIILFSSSNNNKNKDLEEYNFNKLNTIQNLESDEKRMKKNLILNKNANILSTQILKNTNNNTIETKNINYSIKRPKKIGRNLNENDNEAFTKNKTFNNKNEEDNSLLDLFNNSNKENKNNELNKNVKVLNKSNNNNSSSYSNSNSNSVYNKKKIINENNINNNKKEDISDNNFHLLSVSNSKSQNLFSIENLKKVNINRDSIRKEEGKLRSKIDKGENNFMSNSNLILKKQKNPSPIIFSGKHFNKNRKSEIDLNINEQKENIELNLNENNIRRANSFITNNKVLNKKRQIEEKKTVLEQDLNKILNTNTNISINPSLNIVKEILEDKKYENDIDNIVIKLFDNNDIFIGIMDKNNTFPKKGILYTHNGDYYNGELSEGKKNGQGNIIYANGTKYEGSFKNDFHDGFGKLIQLNGETYEGEWKKGKINGKGMRIHANGNKYIGNYVNNVRNGEGHLIFVNGESYKGNFLNGKANGIGVFKFKNGNVYEGEFKDNLIMGKGSLTLKNGDKYIGFFTNGVINGKGTYIKNNGEKYIGNFEGNKKNGFGKLYDENGKLIKEGIWEKGIYINNK